MTANTQRVHICNYGIGNIHSVIRAFEHVGAECINCTDPAMLTDVERLVIPGVGAFASCMNAFRSHGFQDPVMRIIDSSTPVLGICVGMQMLADASEEFGAHAGLGVVPGRVVPIPQTTTDGDRLPVPHISWSALQQGGHIWEGTPFNNLERGAEVYFVHSYQLDCANPENLLARFEYGGHLLTAAVIRDNVVGVQFHPEKSSAAGLSIIRGFLDAGASQAGARRNDPLAVGLA
jgi:imidazole glycerol-phosphate synthase subunit HisH